MTMVPRTGPLSASSAFASTSWYQRGKSSARGVSTRAIGANDRGLPDDPATQYDVARVEQHAEIDARVGVVNDQVGQAAVDQAGEAEPFACPPGTGPQHVQRRHPGVGVQQQHLA